MESYLFSVYYLLLIICIVNIRTFYSYCLGDRHAALLCGIPLGWPDLLIFFWFRFTHSIYISSSWPVPLSTYWQLNSLSFTEFAIVPKTVPPYWNITQNLRNYNDIIVPNHRIYLFKRLPLYTLSVAWNEIAIKIKGQSNKTTFRIALNDYS